MFVDLFTLENLWTLAMLILLQAVLGFDNLLYISIESKRVAADRQQFVRRIGIALAIFFRLILLFAIVSAIEYFQDILFGFKIEGIAEAEFNGHSLIVLFGGAFIIYTAFKEILHMIAIDDLEKASEGKNKRSVLTAVVWIVSMNLVFSFDSILSAMALTEVFLVMATAIVISGIMMIALVDHVAEFLKTNRMYEVLGLFILFVVGIMLISEGGHLAHIKIYDVAIEPMSKSTFYFVIFIMVFVDLVQSRYQKKIFAMKEIERAKKSTDEQQSS